MEPKLAALRLGQDDACHSFSLPLADDHPKIG